MPEESFYPTAFSFYFQVSIGGSSNPRDAAFRDVSGLAVEMETETFVEGGENTMVYRLPKVMKYQNLVLSRGLASRSSPLVTWCIETLQGGLAKRIQTKALIISLLGPGKSESEAHPLISLLGLGKSESEARPLHSWTVVNAYPVKWEVESFNAEKSEVAIEKIEFAFTHFSREPITS